jgi:hypothetical protein
MASVPLRRPASILPFESIIHFSWFELIPRKSGTGPLFIGTN